jgi:hypothetical protein
MVQIILIKFPLQQDQCYQTSALEPSGLGQGLLAHIKRTHIFSAKASSILDAGRAPNHGVPGSGFSGQHGHGTVRVKRATGTDTRWAMVSRGACGSVAATVGWMRTVSQVAVGAGAGRSGEPASKRLLD